jgi:CheY-like chemotaxis protein
MKVSGTSESTSFTFAGSWYVLPRDVNDSSSPSSDFSNIGKEPRDRPFVLIADDEAIINETLAAILSYEGYAVATADNGISAVEEARRLAPDIVLLDVAMPRLNGIEAAKQILSSLPKTRVLLFSGQAETADLLAQARKAGHEFEVLAKPVKPQVLLQALRALEGRK